eukprot:3476267-Prorocentrum_lima.AAC.1
MNRIEQPPHHDLSTPNWSIAPILRCQHCGDATQRDTRVHIARAPHQGRCLLSAGDATEGEQLGSIWATT